MENRTKVKVRKWIDTPQVRQYEAFISSWHSLLTSLEERMEENGGQDFARKASMFVLKHFYLTPYDGSRDFYDQFGKRLEASSVL